MMKLKLPFLLLSVLLVFSRTVLAAGQASTWTDPQSSIAFVKLPKGCFRMGNDKAPDIPVHITWIQAKYSGVIADDEGPAHEVCVDAFWLGTHEITWGQWQKVMGGAVPPGEENYPARNLSWVEAREFINRLNQAGERYRLPTEAEWEYACLAGGKNDTAVDPDALALQARFAYEGSGATYAVGQLAANAFGLYDMLGNVWEWVEDAYRKDGYKRHALYNPKISDDASPKVIRGGSYVSETAHMRCTTRGRYPKVEHLNVIGLRVVREVEEKPK